MNDNLPTTPTDPEPMGERGRALLEREDMPAPRVWYRAGRTDERATAREALAAIDLLAHSRNLAPGVALARIRGEIARLVDRDPEADQR